MSDMKAKRFFFLLFILSTILFASSCVTSSGVYHTVNKGETLWRISKTYGVDIQLIAEYNDIYDPSLIYAGQKLFIPGARRALDVPPRKDGKPVSEEEELGKIVVNKGMFLWPTDGIVYSLFGARWGETHRGIDITGKSGTPIVASKSGKVIFAGYKGGYGNMVKLQHVDGYETLYGHMSKVAVKVGDEIKEGEVIGYMGSTGKSTGPHLHFEIIKENTVRNPLFFLP